MPHRASQRLCGPVPQYCPRARPTSYLFRPAPGDFSLSFHGFCSTLSRPFPAVGDAPRAGRSGWATGHGGRGQQCGPHTAHGLSVFSAPWPVCQAGFNGTPAWRHGPLSLFPHKPSHAHRHSCFPLFGISALHWATGLATFSRICSASSFSLVTASKVRAVWGPFGTSRSTIERAPPTPCSLAKINRPPF